MRGTPFGTLLRTYRKAAGLTQEQLAERAGYSTVYVSMLERGQRSPLTATADVFADALVLAPRERAALKVAARPEGEERRRGVVGRAREMQLIERHLRGEGPPALVIAGEPGIGKTRLLREAGLQAGGYELAVLEGGCLRRGGDEPYAPVLQALQSYMQKQEESRLREELTGCGWLVRLLPELTGGPIEPLPGWTIPAEQERRLMDEAIVRFLGNLAGPGGSLLVLDDLQWAGTDALDLLRTVLHAPAPIRILGAYRENEIGGQHPLSTLLADLAHAGLATHLGLGPLSDAEAAELLDRLLNDENGVGNELRERVLRRADGVPFFVVSCAHGIRTGAIAEGEREEIPWDLTQSIRQRVAVLPDKAREMLGRAAVVGRRVPRSLLVDGGGEDEWTVLRGLDAACEARLLEETGADGYQFTHDVVREVVEADLGAARRTALHRKIGNALERRGGAVEALAYHYARSGDDEKAIQYLDRAGAGAEAQHANATAEGYYHELVDRLDGLGRTEEAVRGREKLGRVLTTVGRYNDALAVLERAAADHRRAGDAEGEARAMAQIGRVHYLRGTPDEGIAQLEAMRGRIEQDPRSLGPALVNIALAPLYLARSKYREQLEAAAQAADVARALGDDRLLAEAEVWRGCALNQLDHLDEGRRVQEAAIPLAEAARDLTVLAHALNDVGFLYEIGGEFGRSRTYKQRALEVAKRVGDPAAIANMAFRCGQNAFLSGEWEPARQYFEDAAADARRVDALSILAYPLFGLGLLALAEGDGDAVGSYAEECLAIARRSADVQMQRSAEILLAEQQLQDGRPREAYERLRTLEIDEAGLGLSSALPSLAEACLKVGNVAEAETYVADGVRRANSSHNRVGLVDIMWVQALVLMEQQRWSEAANVLGEALQLAGAMPYPYAQARLLYVEGMLRTQTREHEQARQSMAQALAIFEQLGAKQPETYPVAPRA